VLEHNELALAQLEEMHETISGDLPELGAAIIAMCSASYVPKEDRQRWMEWVAKLVIYDSYVSQLFDTMKLLVKANIETVYILEGLQPPEH
jgi:hypothetical protein